MINFKKLLKTYLKEEFKTLPGLYSNFDSRILYSFIRDYKPKSILDVAPREGKTTSSIIEALLKNAQEDKDPIDYYIFEKSLFYYNKIIKYFEVKKIEFEKLGVDFRLHSDTNIINSKVLDEIKYLDLLFIDANHDYILSAYFVDKLTPLVKNNGYIHFHDMHVNLKGNSLEDLKFISSGVDHEDIVSEDNLKSFYPEIYDMYVQHSEIVNLWEGDIVLNYIQSNNYQYFSCFELTKPYNFPKDSQVENCALYIHKSN